MRGGGLRSTEIRIGGARNIGPAGSAVRARLPLVGNAAGKSVAG